MFGRPPPSICPLPFVNDDGLEISIPRMLPFLGLSWLLEKSPPLPPADGSELRFCGGERVLNFIA